MKRDSPSRWATNKTKPLVKFVYEPAPKSLFWAARFVPGFQYVPWVCLLKKPLSNCQSGGSEIGPEKLNKVLYGKAPP